MKKKRRIALGDLMTIVFENTDTMRFQIQEMARAERMLRDDQIAHEVETYNELIPDPGELSGTLFIEITDDEDAAPVAAAAHGHPAGRRDRGRRGSVVPASEIDEERLTREDEITTTVHYLRFVFTPSPAGGLRRRPGAGRRRPPRVPGVDVELGPEERLELRPTSSATSPR